MVFDSRASERRCKLYYKYIWTNLTRPQVQVHPRITWFTCLVCVSTSDDEGKTRIGVFGHYLYSESKEASPFQPTAADQNPELCSRRFDCRIEDVPWAQPSKHIGMCCKSVKVGICLAWCLSKRCSDCHQHDEMKCTMVYNRPSTIPVYLCLYFGWNLSPFPRVRLETTNKTCVAHAVSSLWFAGGILSTLVVKLYLSW